MSVSFDQTSSRFLPFCPGDGEEVAHLILVVRADPIICGHSTEARALGFAGS